MDKDLGVINCMVNYSEIPLTSGIYRIKNIENNKCYIGSAVSLRRRAYEHFSALKRNKHFNFHLQSSFNAYQESKFIFEVLEICDKNILIEKENFYINEQKSNTKEAGYNTQLAGATWLGKKHSPETIEKIRQARSKQVFSKESILKSSKSRTGRKMNFSPETLKKLSEKAKNMDRSFTQTSEFKEKISEISRQRAKLKGKRFTCHQNNKIYCNCGEASEDLNLSYKCIWKVLKGKSKSIHGFTFSYVI
jgi:group I intron endonuclease